ncbi:MAG: hypothetical protein IT492_15470 [Gammaproteobacteria bacterium]|nr:hypothetical protein [Gammaproteobacteria bacterium]
MAQDQGGEGTEAAKRVPLKTDLLDGAYLPGLKSVVVTGHHGVVGQLKVSDDAAKLELLAKHPDEDFTCLEAISDSMVLIGSATGKVYSYDGATITELASLSEFNEPVLDIAHDGNNIWVVGARGLIAHSTDGKKFDAVEVKDISQPLATFPDVKPADYYMGVSNISADTVQFNATVNGKPAVADTDYTLYPDEGFVQVANQLDANPAPTITFKFNPGPPFRIGDVSWNVVLVANGKVTIGGEFGMVLQSEDGGASWVRRDTRIVPHEPEPAYWLGGTTNGDQIWLVGAAGISEVSHDGGVTWTNNPAPGREGIFGITLLPDGKPLIAGAVGLIGVLDGDSWKLADRTQLHLLSWLKTPVVMPDGSILVLGGRATAIRYKDGAWTRVPVDL